MKVSVMVMDDDGKFMGMARDSFDEDKGYHWEALHKLYQRARARRATKIKRIEEQEDEQS